MDNPVFSNCGPDTPHIQNVPSNQQTHSIHPHHLSMNYQRAGRFSRIQYQIDNKSDTSLNQQISGYDKSYLIPSEDNYIEDDLPILDDTQNLSPPHYSIVDKGGLPPVQMLQESQSFIGQMEEQKMQNQYNQLQLQNQQMTQQYPSVNPISSDSARLPYNISNSRSSQPNPNFLGNTLNQRPPLNIEDVGIFALIVCLCFNPLFGIAAFIIALIGQHVEPTDYEKAKTMKLASLTVSLSGILVGAVIITIVLVVLKMKFEF